MAFNLWARFKRLLPDQPLMVCTVASVDAASGTSMVTTAGGESIRVLGKDFAVADTVYVRDGAIIEAAPALPHYDLEV